jgi:hypothetical protein
MTPNHETIGTVLRSTENNRLSPHEFEQTAEPSQMFYTYGQTIQGSLPSSIGIVLERAADFQRPDNSPNSD